MRYKVDLFLCGHVHAYERSYPVFDKEAYFGQEGQPDFPPSEYKDAAAPVHLVTGAGGNIEVSGSRGLGARALLSFSTTFEAWPSTKDVSGVVLVRLRGV